MSQVITEIDGFQLKLTNLDKVLWPESHITKAELISYYINIYDFILPLIKDRPLTLIRFPDGITGNKFYSKNAPDFIPEWLPTCQIEDIKYVYIEKKADLVYLANLAALEFHAMTIKASAILHPDTMIFDLDPSEGVGFDVIKNICHELCHFLQEMGYITYIKTSGGKGLHIYVPLESKYSREEVFNAAKSVGLAFSEKNKLTTLKISKEKREGKILIDIYRNHQSQTCIAALSTRAKPGAPVSMPILMDELFNVKSSDQFNIKNASEYLTTHHPWQNFGLVSSTLHNVESEQNKIISDLFKNELSTYASKRDFTKTNEPSPLHRPPTKDVGNRFVLQMHDATNLHYDLRLEENGVLASWAIPKHLPFIQKTKKLAIRTEDHPLPYLDFEGNIPKGEYGGGKMWIFDSGHYILIKKDEKSLHFRLHGKFVSDEFILFHTNENQWLVENKSTPNVEFIFPVMECMLADQETTIPSGDQYIFELKWDGIRVLCFKAEDKVIIKSKSGRDITEKFPEIAAQLKEIDAEYAIIDGELVSIDQNGVPVFANIISRMHSNNVKESASKNNAVLYVFDLLYLDGIDIRKMPLIRRRELLTANLGNNKAIRLSEGFEDGKLLFEAAKNMQLEGIMAKKKTSPYLSDQRSKDWIKIKVRTLMDVTIIGYTKGKGDRSHQFGALHVAKIEQNELVYMGKVGTGFDQKLMAEMYQMLISLPTISKPIKDQVEEEYLTTWLQPSLQCEVQYASLTPNGTLREPVFMRMKYPDE